MSPMIGRLWTGRCTPENAEAYETLLITKIIPELDQAEGCLGAYVLRRPDRGRIRVQLGFPRRSDIRHAYVQLDVISPHLAEPGHPRDRPVVWDRLIAVRFWPPYRAPPIAYLGAVRPRSGAARTSKC